MVADRLQRRMAAIFAADVVGYSRLIGQDEETTLATLRAHRAVIDGLIAHYRGRVFGSAGDSVIAEFASPVDAVRCATDIQLAIDKCNADLPEHNRMRFRIGINLGDVVVDGDNLMGDGVNIAARLEALSHPGGICISETIHAQVRDRLALTFLDLGEHKVKNIERPVRAYRVPLASEEQVKSPFRGLNVFDFDHANIFFGRARATATCSERLQQLAASGSAFLLIYGMSGSGKSSLLRAGLLPAITQPGAVAGIGLWRRGLFRPSEGSDAIASLVAGLIQESALPELAQERTATELADLLRANPVPALALVRAALGKAATASGTPPSQARLVLAVDQMEELFTTQAEPAFREALVRLLAAFAASGFVWVIGTIRADFFHRCGEVPGFSALKDGLGSYELLPPTGPEIAQIIREPARAAGLRFEQVPEQGHLDDVLQDAAAADPGSLPLLEFVLDALYEAGRERRLLTFAAYRALGGLEGAIARRADEIIDALPPNVQDELPAVLRALTTVRPGDEAITASPAKLIEVAGTPARSALVNTLIGARLLISDESAEGVAVVRVAHEALVTRWPRARDIINANRAFLETRARLQADARRWQSDNRNSELLLPAGKRLAEGEELLSARREEIDDEIVEYIEASSQAEKERQEKDRHAERALIEAAEAAKRERLEREAERIEREAERRSLEESAQRERLEREAERQSIEAAAAKKLARRTRIAAGIALLLAIGAGAGAVVGFSGQREAIRQTERAEKNASDAQAAAAQAQAAETQAIEAKNQALQNQSLSLAFLAQRTAEEGDTEAAILLALEALPAEMSASERPFLFEAEAALYNALAAHRQTLILRHPAGVTHAVFSPNGERIVSSSYDNIARFWSARDGSEIAVLTGHRGVIESAKFSPDGSRILTVARDSTARIWDARSGKQLFVLGGMASSFAFHRTAIFSPDGSQILTAGTGEINLWNADTGKKRMTVKIWSPSLAAFSPDGRTFAAGDVRTRTVGIWNAEDGRLISTWGVDTWPDEVALSPDGGRLLISSWGSSFGSRDQCRLCLSRLWNVWSGTELATFSGHRSDTRGGTFSHDGRLVATVSMDGTARLWNGVTGGLLSELGDETPGLTIRLAGTELQDQDVNFAFSPDDTLLATVSLEDNVRIWDVAGASEFTVIHGHTDLVEHVEFSPDGSRLLTASHDGTARVWDVDGVLTTTLHHLTTPTFAAFSSDGVRIVTLGADSAAHVWEATTGSRISTLVDRDSGPLQHAAFSPDGRNVVTASESGRLTSWDAESARVVARFEGHERRVVNVQFSPDGQLLLSTSLDGTARLWDASQGTPITVLHVGATIRNARFSPDGSLVLAGSKDGSARLWRTDGSEFKVLTAPNTKISAAAFSPDGQLVATGSFDGTAQLWSIDDGKLINTLKGPTALVANIEFSLDGQFVVAAYRDGTTRIWSVNDGAEQAVLRGHRGGVDRATFSPNGLNVVTASSGDRTVRLWERESGRQIAIIAGQEDARDVEPAPTSAAYSLDGTMIAIVGDEQSVRIIRAFPTPHDLIGYARSIVPRELTPCERRRFFLPVEGEVGNCPS